MYQKKSERKRQEGGKKENYQRKGKITVLYQLISGSFLLPCILSRYTSQMLNYSKITFSLLIFTGVVQIDLEDLYFGCH